MTTQTLLIGIDGATFKILDPLMEDGMMPFLNGFVHSGTRAELRSVIPPLTPPAWTSLMTGRRPGSHGIFDFFVKERPDSRHIRFANFNDISAETIWSIADRHDLRATVLNFPLMFPPPKIDGHVVSGFIPWRQLRLGCHPRDLYERLKAIPGFNPRELAMDMDLEEKAVEGCEPDEYEEWIQLHTRRERHWFQVLRTLMLEEPSDLTGVLFDGMDKIQHLCWRFLDPAYIDRELSAWEQRVRELCLDYFRQLDNLLAEMVDLAGSDATVVLASDHGFGAQTGTFFVNTWLEQRGYLAWADDEGPVASKPGELGIGQLARHVYQLDWERTKAYAPTPSANGIHIVVAGEDDEHGVPEAHYEEFRDQLMQGLLDYVDPELGEPVVSRVWTCEEAFAGPQMEWAPDLTLELRDGGLVSIVASEAPFKLRSEPSGTHRPEGIFLANGPGVRQNASVAELAVEDVAPLVLYTLGLPIPGDLDGRVPTEILKPAALEAKPVETVASSEPYRTPRGPVLDKQGEAELLRRLRALGYVE